MTRRSRDHGAITGRRFSRRLSHSANDPASCDPAAQQAKDRTEACRERAGDPFDETRLLRAGAGDRERKHDPEDERDEGQRRHARQDAAEPRIGDPRRARIGLRHSLYGLRLIRRPRTAAPSALPWRSIDTTSTVRFPRSTITAFPEFGCLIASTRSSHAARGFAHGGMPLSLPVMIGVRAARLSPCVLKSDIPAHATPSRRDNRSAEPRCLSLPPRPLHSRPQPVPLLGPRPAHGDQLEPVRPRVERPDDLRRDAHRVPLPQLAHLAVEQDPA